ncbi:hypothetical protein SCP_0701910 [Sparassis crispa]|uniref:Uncharacterized protein n=2 Tax=Sparassis crispa TaxID=139825 RepID=A0A401GS09_9APHY|nr:hypothetical protein SCP_0701910 [Sparassis crispa]GBE85005.1 hypothetical protein SCP_0701910 [Sparassis crispa]
MCREPLEPGATEDSVQMASRTLRVCRGRGTEFPNWKDPWEYWSIGSVVVVEGSGEMVALALLSRA